MKTYKKLHIYENDYDEFCIVDNETDEMLTYNAGFKTRKEAEQFIKDFNNGKYPTEKEQLENAFKFIRIRSIK